MLDLDNPAAVAEYHRLAAFHEWKAMKKVADEIGAAISADGSDVTATKRYAAARAAELCGWCHWLDLTREVTA